jgi:hypothetical protein
MREGLLLVSFTAGTAREQALVVNAIVAAYLRDRSRAQLMNKLENFDAALFQLSRPDRLLPARLRRWGLEHLQPLSPEARARLGKRVKQLLADLPKRPHLLLKQKARP